MRAITSPTFLFLFAGGFLSCFSSAQASEELKSIVTEGDVFGQVRYRFEHTDQDGFSKDASAHTVRTDLGFKTGNFYGFQGLVEGSVVRHIGDDDFNDTTNGNSQYPVIADPDNEELNQLWLSYDNIPDTNVKFGRQIIKLDNQRFIGSVEWRQNNQTYDAVAINNQTIDDLSLTYSYVGNVNRINGDDHPKGDLDSNSHIVHGNYGYADWLGVSAYAYLLDVKKSPNLSSATYGLRATGKQPISDAWTFSYEAEVAHQTDYADYTDGYGVEYIHLSPAISGYGFTFKPGYELLGSDGSNAFQTPFATGHAFNGWADQFLTTPSGGLQDLYFTVKYRVSDLHQWVDGTTITGTYHKFDADKSGDFGSEFDLGLTKSFALDDVEFLKAVAVTVKYADYRAEDAPFADKQVFWTQFGVTF
ncbi:MAG: alginate export family protein [Halopseudomonas aestusnigri]